MQIKKLTKDMDVKGLRHSGNSHQAVFLSNFPFSPLLDKYVCVCVCVCIYIYMYIYIYIFYPYRVTVNTLS